ncbi:trifunctional dihydropteroate synthetase [Chytriomyces hyalinus]|nr:trifunctional dihydropteroate synthetase [Chytriomyces hyalinus]KAJ3264589.1 trifunctional dihydropteroate synthetase [Chytriomyces hyalinus]
MDAGYDRIILQNLRVDCLVGVDAWERPKHQPLIISVIVASDVKGSVSSVGDGLSSQHTVSYGDIQTRIREFAAVHSYRTLEALAMAIAHHCFTQCGVRSLNNEGGVSVYIEKPKALLHAQSVGIEITRTRQELEELDALLTAKDNGPSQSLASKIPKSPLPLEPYDLQIGADKIIIRQLACSTIIGINPWERVQKQRLFIDITVHLHLVSSFILVDKIPNVFNFRTMVKAIAEYVESTSFKTLEMLIENIAGILGREFHAPKVWVRISKPSAVIYADTAAVEITRTRDSAGPIRKKVRLDGDGVSDGDLHTVYIGIGSNLGNRAKNISFGIQELCKDSSVNRLLDTSFLYETKPMYVTEQPNFLNAAFKIETKLTPSALLTHIKDIEAAAGRNFGEIRNGPRPLDMDILFYDSLELKTPTLEIPHKLIHEREFVLRPLCDIAPTFPHPTRFRTCSHLLGILLNTEGYDTSMPMLQVTPFHTRLTSSKDSPVWTWSTRTRVMGILNVTPDSFSDGGEFTDLERAVAAAKAMISAGAHVIDIGGQSTRPGAEMVTEEVECARVVPVVEALRREIGEGVLISVDTFRAAVAKKAILAGADFINDVTGAAFDPNMVTVMAELNVPVCIMHMRGDPKTMQSLTTYENNDVTSEVRTVLTAHVSKLIHAGVYRWNIILDPGIGFAKTGDQNFKLLRELHAITAKGALARFPLLVGPSRKGFLKAGLDEKRQADPKERVWATAAACCAAVMGGAGILRVHDVKEMVDVIATSDILYRR